MNRLVRILLPPIACAALLGVAAAAVNFGYLRFNYPSRDRYEVRGIDISHHQGKIAWNELASEHLDFVIVKATEGGDYKDPLFAGNVDSATKNGYKVGAYHFYRLCTDNATQLGNFLDATRGRTFELAPTIDLEFGGNCHYPGSKQDLQRKIDSFVVALHDSTGVHPILYATKEFYSAHLAGQDKKCPIWIRDIFWKPSLPDGRSWTIWQYANRARIRGVEGHVDLDAMRGADLPSVARTWKFTRPTR